LKRVVIAAPALLLDAVHDHGLELVACRENLEEPYFRALLDRRDAEQAASALERVAVMLADPTDPESTLRNSSDDYLLALARSGDAEAIVTGDKDLLDHAGL